MSTCGAFRRTNLHISSGTHQYHYCCHMAVCLFFKVVFLSSLRLGFGCRVAASWKCYDSELATDGLLSPCLHVLTVRLKLSICEQCSGSPIERAYAAVRETINRLKDHQGVLGVVRWMYLSQYEQQTCISRRQSKI